jgi:hypothetical protein
MIALVVSSMRSSIQTVFFVDKDCFVSKGSTIGPIIATLTGVRTVDIGVSCWSMHSIRETLGVTDVLDNFKLLQTFFKDFEVTMKNLYAIAAVTIAGPLGNVLILCTIMSTGPWPVLQLQRQSVLAMPKALSGYSIVSLYYGAINRKGQSVNRLSFIL